MALLTEEEIDALVKGKRHSAIDIDEDTTIVLAAPKRADCDRWVDSEKHVRDSRALVESCLLHPTVEEFRKLLDDYPFLLSEKLGMEVLRLAGMGKGTVRTRSKTIAR